MILVRSQHLDTYKEQHEFRLVAALDGEYAGWLDYSLYEGQVYVKYMEATKLRRGVGTALVLKLQETYPDCAIEFGYATSDGNALLNALEWRIVINQAKVDARQELSALEEVVAEYERQEILMRGASQVEKEMFILRVADWNEVSDRIDELTAFIANAPEEFRYVAGPKVQDVGLSMAV